MRSEAVVDGAHYPVVIVGGGQAGLAMSWWLVRAGVEHLVIERETVGHEWADARWDAFCLVTPNRQCTLPGWPYAGDDPDGFMVRDEIVAYLRGYADSFPAPVAEHTAVLELREAPAGEFAVTTTAGTITADQVVLATGGYHFPTVPAAAQRIPVGVTQLHSSRYRNPGALPPGAVLVVGTGQSGAQIAEDLHLAGREVHLATGSAPRVARFYRGRDCMTWLHEMGHYDVGVTGAEHEAQREKTNHYVTGRGGGHDLDLRAFARDGMRLYGRLTGIDPDGRARFAPDLAANLDHADSVAESIKDLIDSHIDRHGLAAPPEPRYTPPWTPDGAVTELDLTAAGITTVIWAIGYRADWRWVKLPAFDGTGYPTHLRGVTSIPGLYVLGLPWLSTWGSGRFLGVARDSEHLAVRIMARHPVEAPLSSLIS